MKNEKNNIAEIESKLYEVLGIVRMIGQLQPGDDPAQILRDLEAATWAARAAETVISETLGMIED